MTEGKVKDNKKVKLYLNSNGEIVNSADVPMETQGECDNIIKFCCTSTVPDGFVLDFTITNLGICIDTSELSCCLETKTTMCEVPNPCDGTLNCPVDIQAVHLVGCTRLFANVGDLTPVSGIAPLKCAVCCNTTTCVNQIIGFTCGKTGPCEPCFAIPLVAVEFSIIIDDCGRQMLVVKGEAFVEFVGCDC